MMSPLLAAAAHHRAGKFGGLVQLVGQQAGVAGPVEGEAGIVGHAAVHRDVVFIAGDLLDRAHGVEGQSRVSHDAASGLHVNLGQGDAQAGAGALGRGGHLGHLGVHVQNGVALDVAHAVAAAQVKLPGLVAMAFSMWAANSSMITAARSNTSSAKTWEPTWQWKPTSSTWGWRRVKRVISSAWPVSMALPNLESTLPVAMAS